MSDEMNDEQRMTRRYLAQRHIGYGYDWHGAIKESIYECRVEYQDGAIETIIERHPVREQITTIDTLTSNGRG